jgi:hypothetical protein
MTVAVAKGLISAEEHLAARGGNIGLSIVMGAAQGLASKGRSPVTDGASRGLRMSLEDSRRSLWGFPLDISSWLGGPGHCYATPAVIRHSQVGAPAKVQPLRSEPALGLVAQTIPPPSGIAFSRSGF